MEIRDIKCVSLLNCIHGYAIFIQHIQSKIKHTFKMDNAIYLVDESIHAALGNHL